MSTQLTGPVATFIGTVTARLLATFPEAKVNWSRWGESHDTLHIHVIMANRLHIDNVIHCLEIEQCRFNLAETEAEELINAIHVIQANTPSEGV